MTYFRGKGNSSTKSAFRRTKSRAATNAAFPTSLVTVGRNVWSLKNNKSSFIGGIGFGAFRCGGGGKGGVRWLPSSTYLAFLRKAVTMSFSHSSFL